MIPAQDIPSLLPELRKVSDVWLAEKHTREKGFSLGYCVSEYLRRFPAGVIRQNGKIIAVRATALFR